MKTVRIVSATPVAGALKNTIEERLSRTQNDAVLFEYVIDPSAEGISAEDGGRVYRIEGTGDCPVHHVRVMSAAPLTGAQKRRIEQRYRTQNIPATFVYSVDAALIGGLKIIDGESLFDGTVAGRLTDIKRALK